MRIAACLIFALVTLCACSPKTIAQDYRGADSAPPDITEWMPQPAILVFSKTAGWRHNEGIAGADLFFVQLARRHEYGIFTTANAAIFNPRDLARFDVVVFNNATGNGLAKDQQRALRDWIEQGGGWIGLHGAGDASQEWPWYQERLIGPKFIGHIADPQFQDARLETLADGHPVTQGLPASWLHNDEWYSFDSRPQDHGMRPLVGLDESSYSPRNDLYGEVSDLRMGKGANNHPIVWSRCPNEGRSVYSAIGHNETSYSDPNYSRLLENAFLWVARKVDAQGEGCGGEPVTPPQSP